jgi:hypothetical protein
MERKSGTENLEQLNSKGHTNTSSLCQTWGRATCENLPESEIVTDHSCMQPILVQPAHVEYEVVQEDNRKVVVIMLKFADVFEAFCKPGYPARQEAGRAGFETEIEGNLVAVARMLTLDPDCGNIKATAMQVVDVESEHHKEQSVMLHVLGHTRPQPPLSENVEHR